MGRGLGASTKRGTVRAVGVTSSLGCDLSLLGLGQVQSVGSRPLRPSKYSPWGSRRTRKQTWVCCPESTLPASAPAPCLGLRVNASGLLFNGLLCSLALHCSQPAWLPGSHMSLIKIASRLWSWTVSLLPWGSRPEMDGWEHRHVTSLCFL